MVGLTVMKLARVCWFAWVLMSASVLAQEQNWWPVQINVYNPACTDGDVSCWTDKRNRSESLEVVDYIPLLPKEVTEKHHICVSFPHMKDSYFAGVAYGIISEGERLGQKITLVEAGGYTNLERQLNQVEDCISNGAEALVIAPISRDGNAKQIDVIRENGIPVVVIITGLNTAVDANSLQSFYNMGFFSCKWVVDQSVNIEGKVKMGLVSWTSWGWLVGGW